MRTPRWAKNKQRPGVSLVTPSSNTLPRFHVHQQQAAFARKLATILLDTGEPAPKPHIGP